MMENLLDNKELAFERQRINILKNQIDFLVKENKDRLNQIYNLGERVNKLENIINSLVESKQ